MTTAAPVYSHPTNPGFAEFLSSDTMLLPGGLTLPTFTPGSVIFAGTGGALAQDNDKLFFDATNFALGVGTASPGVNTVSIVQPVKTTGSPIALKVTGGAHTTLTAATEAPDVFLALARTVQFATGDITTQRALLIDRPKYSFVGASAIANWATVGIVGAPSAHTNATVTASHGLLISSNDVTDGGACSNSFGLTCNAQTGATNNYSAAFYGCSGTEAAVLGVLGNVTAGGKLRGIVYTGVVNTAQTATQEIESILLTTAGREWDTGAIASQREVKITQPLYSFVGASVITNAATLGIMGAPKAEDAHATITNSHALIIESADVTNAGACTSSYGLTCNAQSGATTNYAAQFMGGNVGFGTATPGAQIECAGDFYFGNGGNRTLKIADNDNSRTLTIKTGDASGGGGAGTGTVYIDTGAKDGVGVAGSVTVGGTNATSLNLGRAAGNIGFFGTAAAALTAAWTQTYATATRTNNPASTAAFTGIDNAQVGLVYAQVADLNTLRTDVLMMAQLINQLIDDGQTYGLLQ